MKITDASGNNESPLRRIGKGAKYAFAAALLFLGSCNANPFQKLSVTETPTRPAPTEVPTKTTTPTLLPVAGPLDSPLPTPTSRPVPTEVNTPKLAISIEVATEAPITGTPFIDYKATNVVIGEDLDKEKAKVKKLEEQLKAEKDIASLNSIKTFEEKLELVINLCTYCYDEVILTKGITPTKGITSTGIPTVTFNVGTRTNFNFDMSGVTRTYTTEMGSVFLVDDRMVTEFESFLMLKYVPELLSKQNKNTLELRIADRIKQNIEANRGWLYSLVFAFREFGDQLGDQLVLEVFIPKDGCLPEPVRATSIPKGTPLATATGTPTPPQRPTGTLIPEPSRTPDKEPPTSVPTRNIEPTNTPPQNTATPSVDKTNTPPPPEPTVRVDPTEIPTRIFP